MTMSVADCLRVGSGPSVCRDLDMTGAVTAHTQTAAFLSSNLCLARLLSLSRFAACFARKPSRFQSLC